MNFNSKAGVPTRNPWIFPNYPQLNFKNTNIDVINECVGAQKSDNVFVFEKCTYHRLCRNFTLVESFWFALTSFTPQGGGETPKAISGRVLVAAYWVFVVLMLATFTANLAAFLTVERMQVSERSHFGNTRHTCYRTRLVHCTRFTSAQPFLKWCRLGSYPGHY